MATTPTTRSLSLNGEAVDSFPTETDEEGQLQSPTPMLIKSQMAKEQELYAQRQRKDVYVQNDTETKLESQANSKENLRETVRGVASKWIDPKEFFIGSDGLSAKHSDHGLCFTNFPRCFFKVFSFCALSTF